MKNYLVLCLVIVFASMSLSAEGPYKKGSNDINAGIGFGSTLVGSITLPPINASYEIGITDDISAGGYFGFAMSEEGWSGYTWKYTHIIIGARGSYHFYNEDNMDLYGGLMLGYNVVSVDSPGDYAYDAASSGITYSAFLGGRYYFSENLGAFAELGYGVAYISLGITFKL